MSKNLVIVESPAKAKTIEGYLGKDFIVKSSMGHVRDLPKGEGSIDVKNGFIPKYEVTPDKIKTVSELKSLAKTVDEVWLATDDDREGEAISWHLKEALGLKGNPKRIVFREITKTAIQKAILSPRTIDMDLVNAQQARRVMDRLIGFELSPVLWSKIRSGLSAGRVQSVAVRVIVEREKEIEKFSSQSSFKVTANFDIKGGKTLTGELSKNFEIEGDATNFLSNCIGATYSIKSLETKPAKKSPSPPFTTSTLQQEASRKLGFAVATTMSVAQRLYEAGKISYMRTDSTNLSEEALGKAKAEIVSSYGPSFAQERKFKTKNESAQEAHEAIRPTDFSVKNTGESRQEERLYDLIWKRAISSQMSDALLERTTATISISTVPQELIAQGEVIKFEGFLKVYLEGKDDEDEESKTMLPPLSVGEILNLNVMKAVERFTRPAARYTEASLVKQLEELGIGRPSTYAPTISTIIKREYVTKEDRDGKERFFKEIELKNDVITSKISKETYGTEKAKLFPTNTGIVVNDFLVENFDKVVDFQFTVKVEKEFDEIAEGKIAWQTMIGDFYKDFHGKIEESKSAEFSSKAISRDLGLHPQVKKAVTVKMGRYGPYAQIGDKENGATPQYAKLKAGQLLSSITLEEAIELFKLPREVGFFEDLPMIVAIGKLGPYVKHDDKFTSLGKEDDPYSIEEERCIELILEKRKAAASEVLGTFENNPITGGKGKFGPYVKHADKFYSLPKGQLLEELTFETAIEIINKKRDIESNKILKSFTENESVKIVNGMYGAYIAIGKRNVKIPKDKEPLELTLADCLALAEATPETKKAPARKGKK